MRVTLPAVEKQSVLLQPVLPGTGVLASENSGDRYVH